MPRGQRPQLGPGQLTVDAAASRLGVNENTVRRWVDAGALAGGRVDDSPTAARWVDEQAVEALRPADPVMTVKEAAAVLGVASSTVRRWLDVGELPGLRVNPAMGLRSPRLVVVAAVRRKARRRARASK